MRKLILPVAVHAIGYGALDMVLSALESVPGVSRRDRVIHRFTGVTEPKRPLPRSRRDRPTPFIKSM
ncbi:hypothetical protein [Alicyclobacillus dauci]|uniref:Uncharacterized protein n=1 Tax=Alicyclobacillus dauci TaxID=1475485 RepID=A0ABY6Z4C2_9BACL|nr:hypothetical protein [Alicyclobacillus dauci]WAH37729.1 hypothetical protein NZD86_04290 [Alicyclobacillus dauci]